MTYTNRLFGSGLLGAALFAGGLATFGCATTPPPRELVDARTAYREAAAGNASTYDPAALHTARESLDAAERAYAYDPGGTKARDLGYIADRKAKVAMASGDTLFAEAEQQKARQRLDVLAASATRELRGTRRALQESKVEGAKTAAQLAAEKEARLAAEKNAAAALDSLKKMEAVMAVQEEERGTVITLSGAVLFPSGESTLLPAAQGALDNVAEVLLAEKDRKILIEGHTDSVGSHSFNMELSRNRANAVRDYLVSKGVPQKTIEAQGVGPDRPVADNKSAEGRANNRRVEIVVRPAE
jgi:outer membrane protein OmpA-like peptidoglycan-associated protein